MTLRDKTVYLTRSASSSGTVPRKSPSSATTTASPNVERGQRVRRRLFGGITCNRTDGWVSNQLKLLDENEVFRESQLQGPTFRYDFKNDCPIVNGNQDEYIFEAVDEREVPSFYRPKTSSSLDRRERIAPPDVFASARKASSSFVVIMQVHDSVAYNTRSHDIITFGDSLKTSQPSGGVSLKASLSHRPVSRIECSVTEKDKDSKSDQEANFNRKRTMKQQTLTEFLPVVRCKRRSLPDKKPGNTKCLEPKNFSSNRSFRICKAQDTPSGFIDSGALKKNACDVDNRRITRSMCA